MAGLVFRPRPRGIVLFRDGVGVFHPTHCLNTAGGRRGKAGRILKHQADHRGEKGRLRAGEIVSAVGVENGAVVLHFEEEVIDDTFRECFSVVGFQSENNKKTIPAIHFVEAATGNDVRVGQIEQARRGEFLGAHVAQLLNVPRQCDDADVAALSGGSDLGRRGKTGGQIKHGDRGHLGIGKRCTIRGGTGERVPRRVDVTEGCLGIRRGRGGRLGGGSCKRSQKQPAKQSHAYSRGNANFWSVPYGADFFRESGNSFCVRGVYTITVVPKGMIGGP